VVSFFLADTPVPIVCGRLLGLERAGAVGAGSWLGGKRSKGSLCGANPTLISR
jgi:hypothetical protein